MSNGQKELENGRYFNDEWNAPQKENKTTLSEKVKKMLMTDKTLTDKQQKRLDAFYLELKEENL